MLYNFVGLTGMVIKKSEIHRDENKQYALCFVNVVRDNRDVGDGKTIMKIDYPIIMCHDSKIIAQMVELEERDRIRNFQPPVRGDEIMEILHLPPCNQVGEIKTAIKDAILDGVIPNEYEPAKAYMLHKAKEMGLLT